MKSNPMVVIISLSIASYLFHGCATLLKGSNEVINVNSEPNGAKVYVNGQMLGKTPLRIKLPAKNTQYIEFVKEGYEKKSYVLSNSVGGGWIILDILFGVLPVIIDASTGSWYNFDNNYASVYLEKNITSFDSLIYVKDSEIVSSSSLDAPPFLSIKLKRDKEEIILNGRVSLIYKSSGWEKSLLSGKGIWGFSKNFADPFKETSIPLSKGDVIYMKVDSSTIYRIEVIQEVLNNISLEFTK